jgi:dTDP-4-amino-4,6-dideoxygalactose transaminase
MNQPPLYVTQPHLPPLDEFIPYLERIWSNRILTNGGPFHLELESALKDYLGVDHISLFTNGTIALITALQSLQVSGEVITTPFSFVATANAISWNRAQPVFVDIDPLTLNIDPACIEAAITPRTTAIVPVHCYGRACDVDAIRAIAEKHGLLVVYDAAHAFAVRHGGRSILTHGDLSVLSFHATKVFNTFEGGAVVCRTEEQKNRIESLKNFGFADDGTLAEVGINGKMSEVQAAFGLLQLKSADEAIAARKEIDHLYRELLAEVQGIECLEWLPPAESNYSYFPILVRPSYALSRDELVERLRDAGIFARKYFFPLISEFDAYRHLPSADPRNLPVATEIARQVLCLPLFPHLGEVGVRRVVAALRLA